jgi:hypothetical protein
MRRSLLKVTLDDNVKTYSSKRNEPYMFVVCIPSIILNQTQFQNFRIMSINDGTCGLFEVVNKILKQPHLYLEPLVLVVVLHHL